MYVYILHYTLITKALHSNNNLEADICLINCKTVPFNTLRKHAKIVLKTERIYDINSDLIQKHLSNTWQKKINQSVDLKNAAIIKEERDLN